MGQCGMVPPEAAAGIRLQIFLAVESCGVTTLP
jgi:hypothetical protein